MHNSLGFCLGIVQSLSITLSVCLSSISNVSLVLLSFLHTSDKPLTTFGLLYYTLSDTPSNKGLFMIDYFLDGDKNFINCLVCGMCSYKSILHIPLSLPIYLVVAEE